MTLGKELEVSRGRDKQRFYDMLGQLKDSYRKCGPVSFLLSICFVVMDKQLEILLNIFNVDVYYVSRLMVMPALVH